MTPSILRVVTLLALWLVVSPLVACRIVSEEVACRRDRDCPEPLPVCDGAGDGGVGLCVEAPDGG